MRRDVGETVAELYRYHAATVFRRARAILGTEADANDVVQEIFLGMIERGFSFEGRSSITTWLYSVTTRLCLNRIRDGKNRARLLAENVAPRSIATEEKSAEASAELRQLLVRLPEDLRAVAVHFYLDEMTHEEIAAILECSRRHVGNLVTRVEAHVKKEDAR